MARRKNGDGSWGKKTIKGTTYQYYKKYYPETQEEKYFYGKTITEIKQKRKVYEDAIPDYVKIDRSNMPKNYFEDLCMYWIKKVKPYDGSETREVTLSSYEGVINSRIKGTALGQTQIANLSKTTFEDYRDYLLFDQKLARASIKRTFCVINQFCDYMEENRYIAKNYSRAIKMPSENITITKRKEIKFLPEDDMNKLYAEHLKVSSTGERIYGRNSYIIIFILYTGLRIGECLALKWKDVDMVHNMISVNHTLVKFKQDDKTIVIDSPTTKTVNGTRNVPLNDRAIEMLNGVKKMYPNKTPEDYVFLDSKEQFTNQSNITKTLGRMLKGASCSVGRCGLHSLRHSFGSFLILHGVDIKTVSELLGHSDVSITLNIYIHVINLQKMRAVQLFNVNDLNKDEITNVLDFLKENKITIIEIEDGMLGYISDSKIIKIPMNKTLEVAGKQINNKDIYFEFYK